MYISFLCGYRFDVFIKPIFLNPYLTLEHVCKESEQATDCVDNIIRNPDIFLFTEIALVGARETLGCSTTFVEAPGHMATTLMTSVGNLEFYPWLSRRFSSSVTSMY